MAETLRDLITEKAKRLRDVDALGLVGAEKELVELSSILSSLNKEIGDCHYALNIKKVELLKENVTVAKTNLVSQATQEWKDFMDRMLQREAVVEMIKAIKYYIKGGREELKNQNY